MIDWTYGAEHEFADWDRNREQELLALGYDIDRKDNTIVNSNGIAADPTGKLYKRGGEINTPPTDTPQGQCHKLAEILRLFPEAAVNYRSNLHIHIRIPGLRHNLELLKALATFNDKWLRKVLPIVEPIPKPLPIDYEKRVAYKGALRRYRRRCRSHHTVLPANRTKLQLEAATLEEFFEAEVPRSKDGKPLWHFQPRAAVNVRQLLETETIEFRHFPGTLDCQELLTCVDWCQHYLLCFLNGQDPVQHYRLNFLHRAWPKFPGYVHWMEERYRRTVHDGTLSKGQIAANIEAIEKEIEICGF